MEDALGTPQSVLVLGGASEIAVATLKTLAPKGLKRAVLAGRSPDALGDAAAAVSSAGVSNVATAEWDVSDPADQQALVDAAFDAHGGFDLVLLAAGVLGEPASAGLDAASAIPVVMTNYAGMAIAALAAAGRMRLQGHGTIVVLSSVAAVRPRRSNYLYGSTKAGIDFLCRGLGDSLADSGVRVVVVRPGFVKTKMTSGMPEAPFSTTADAVAAEIVKGLARKGQVVWAPSILRWVSLVMQHLPALLWSKLREREG